MKYLKLLSIFYLILLLNSCGYKKLNSENLNNFKINKIKPSFNLTDVKIENWLNKYSTISLIVQHEKIVVHVTTC